MLSTLAASGMTTNASPRSKKDLTLSKASSFIEACSKHKRLMEPSDQSQQRPGEAQPLNVHQPPRYSQHSDQQPDYYPPPQGGMPPPQYPADPHYAGRYPAAGQPVYGYNPGYNPGYNARYNPGYNPGNAQNQGYYAGYPVGYSPELMLSREPQYLMCPHCRNQGFTQIQHRSGFGTWLLCSGCCLLGCWLGCCLIPFCVKGMKDVEHVCSSCGSSIGRRPLI